MMDPHPSQSNQISFAGASAERGRGGWLRGRGRGGRFQHHEHFNRGQQSYYYSAVEPTSTFYSSQFSPEALYGCPTHVPVMSVPIRNNNYPNYVPYHPHPHTQAVQAGFYNSVYPPSGPIYHRNLSWTNPASVTYASEPKASETPSSGVSGGCMLLNLHWKKKTDAFIEENNRAKDKIISRNCACTSGSRCRVCRSRSRTRSPSFSRSYSRSRSRSSTISRSSRSSGFDRSSTGSRGNSFSSKSRSRSSERSVSSNKSSKFGRSRSQSRCRLRVNIQRSDKYTIQNNDTESDFLDLSKQLQPLTDFIHDKQELLRQAVRSLGGHRLRAVIPSELKQLNLNDVEDECMLILERLDADRLLKILNGSLREVSLESSSSESETTSDTSKEAKKSKKRKRKHRKNSKHKRKTKEHANTEEVKETNSSSSVVVTPESTHDEEKNDILGHNERLQQSLKELLEIESRSKAIKASLLTKGFDANKIDGAFRI